MNFNKLLTLKFTMAKLNFLATLATRKSVLKLNHNTHLKVYHLIARSEHGLMVQILAGLITYLLLAIYCYEQHNEKVSIKRVRQLRIKIQNELRNSYCNTDSLQNFKEQNDLYSYAKT